MTSPLNTYKRYEATADEQKKALAMAQKFINQKSRPELIAIFSALILEQGRLVHEVQAHRSTLGFEPLPEHTL